MKKYIVCQVLLLSGMLFSAGLFADTKIGIGSRVASFIAVGISGSSNSINTISIPVKIDKKILIEPEIIYINSDNEDSDGDITKDKVHGISVGIFKYTRSRMLINTYLGARVSYMKTEDEYIDASGTFSSKNDETVKGISPLIGAEYELNDYFSLAAEIGISYFKSEESESTNTDSRLMVRMLF